MAGPARSGTESSHTGWSEHKNSQPDAGQGRWSRPRPVASSTQAGLYLKGACLLLFGV